MGSMINVMYSSPPGWLPNVICPQAFGQALPVPGVGVRETELCIYIYTQLTTVDTLFPGTHPSTCRLYLKKLSYFAKT